MKQIFRNIISMFTMKRILKPSFTDIVSGEQVFFYKDKYGEEYMAIYPYYPFNFRTKTFNTNEK
jgi:hypothetical protein